MNASTRFIMLRAAEIAEKVGDNIGQCDPRTGELSERDSNRSEGCYQVAERLRVEAEILAESPDAEKYSHEWTITIKADNLRGAMDAAWKCWEAWRDGNEPQGGCCPISMGDRMTYDVNKTKQITPKIEALSGKEPV